MQVTLFETMVEGDTREGNAGERGRLGLGIGGQVEGGQDKKRSAGKNRGG